MTPQEFLAAMTTLANQPGRDDTTHALASHAYQIVHNLEAERDRLREEGRQARAILLHGEVDGGFNAAVIASALNVLGPDTAAEETR